MSDAPGAAGAWADPAIGDALRALAGKMSTGQIAAQLSAQFGVPITRNAVIGKLTREGLPRLAPAGAGVARPGQQRRAPAKKPTAQRPRSPQLKPDPAPARPEDASKAFGEACSILQCRGCRWPVTDPPRGAAHLFCNAPKMDGRPYCAAHYAIAWRQLRRH